MKDVFSINDLLSPPALDITSEPHGSPKKRTYEAYSEDIAEPISNTHPAEPVADSIDELDFSIDTVGSETAAAPASIHDETMPQAKRLRPSVDSSVGLRSFATGAIAGVFIGSIGMFAALVASAPPA